MPLALGIAIIGAGAMGREHAARIAANPRCRLLAVADPAPAAAIDGASRFDSVAGLLANHRPAGAIVATPTHLHASAAMACIEAGVPVLIEKPVAASVASGEAIASAAERPGVRVLVGHHRRYSPAMEAAQAAIAAGRLGRIAALNATTVFHKPDAYFETEWRRGPSGGPILINLVHDIDSMRALAGEIIAVQAAASNAARGFAVEDTAAVILEFACGALGTIVISDACVATRSWEHTSGENPIYPRDAAEDCLFIAGTRGSLAIPTMKLWTQEGPRSWTEAVVKSQIEFTPADPLARQLDHFLDVIEGRAAPLVTARDALRTLAATLAVSESAHTRRRIELTPA